MAINLFKKIGFGSNGYEFIYKIFEETDNSESEDVKEHKVTSVEEPMTSFSEVLNQTFLKIFEYLKIDVCSGVVFRPKFIHIEQNELHISKIKLEVYVDNAYEHEIEIILKTKWFACPPTLSEQIKLLEAEANRYLNGERKKTQLKLIV